MTTSTDRIVEDYLSRLRAALGDLPRARRRELVQEISDHIAEGRASLPREDEAAVRGLLHRLGDPDDIAAEARLALPRKRFTRKERVALALLAITGLVLPATLLGLAEESSGCGTLFTPQLSPRPIAESMTCPPGGGSALFGTEVWEVGFVIVLGVLSLALAASIVRRAGRRQAASTYSAS
jgi:hypothetical protein